MTASLQTDALRVTSAEGVCRLCDRPWRDRPARLLGHPGAAQVEPLGGVGQPLGTASNSYSSSGKSGRPFRDAQYPGGDAAALGAFLVPPKAGEASPWKRSRMTPSQPRPSH